MPKKNNYDATNYVVFTQNVHSGQKEQFNDFCDEVIKYAEENKIEKPKIQFILSKLFKNVLPGLDPKKIFE